MIEALDAIFFEPHPDFQQRVEGPHNRSEDAHAGTPATDRFAVGQVDGALDPAPSPLLVYRWSETSARLTELLAEGGGPMASLEFTNPRSGASVLPTLACGAHRLAHGGSAPVQRSGNTVYVVFQGTGTSVIDGRRFDWRTGDMFVVPSWSVAEHHSEDQADLFSLSDSPVLRALGVYRERVLAEPQAVTSVFGAA